MPADRARARRKASPDDRVPVIALAADEVEAVIGLQIIVARGQVWARGDIKATDALHPRTPELLAITQAAVRSAMTEIASLLGVSVADPGRAPATVSAASRGRA